MNALLQYKQYTAAITCIVGVLLGIAAVLVMAQANAADLVRDPTRPLMELGLAGGGLAKQPEEEDRHEEPQNERCIGDRHESVDPAA